MLHRILKQLRDRDRERGRHLGGNVSEWVDAVYVAGNRRAPVDAGGGDLPKILRGGSFFDSLMVRTSGRNRHIANGVGYNLGFRCATR